MRPEEQVRYTTILGICFFSLDHFVQNPIVIGFQILAWAPNLQKFRIPINKNFRDPPSPWHYATFGRTGGKGLISKVVLKNMKISYPKSIRGPPLLPGLWYNWTEKVGYFQNLSKGSKTSDMTSDGLVEILGGDSADMCAGKIPRESMGG